MASQTESIDEPPAEKKGRVMPITGIMPMHIPSVTSFQVRTEDQDVKVGNTTKVKLEQY